MKIVDRDNGCVKPEYVNSFRTYAGNGEVVLELSQADLAASLLNAKGEAEPDEIVVDIRGRYIFRPEQIQQLIQALISAISGPAQPAPAAKEQ